MTARRKSSHADSETTDCACRNAGRCRSWSTRGVAEPVRAIVDGHTSRVSTRPHARSASAMRARRTSVVVSRLGWVAAINGGVVNRNRRAFRIAAVVTGCEQVGRQE